MATSTTTGRSISLANDNVSTNPAISTDKCRNRSTWRHDCVPQEIRTRKKSDYSWLWVFVGADTTVFSIEPSRSAKPLTDHLGIVDAKLRSEERRVGKE